MPIDNAEVIIGHAKHIAYSDSPPAIAAYITVSGTVDVSLPERELGQSEITNDDSLNFHKEYIPALYEPGTISFTYRYTRTQFTALESIFQLASAAATRGGGAGGAIKLWKVTLPDGSTGVIEGFLTAHNLPVEGAEDSPVVECEVQTRGKMTWTAAA